MRVSWSHVLTGWQTSTISWVGIALEALSAVLYLYGVLRVRRNTRPWPAGRVLAFGLGLISLAFVLQSGFAAYDDTTLWVHMTQHLVIMMLAAPLLALGAPVRLALAAGSQPVRRFVAGILHDPSMAMISGRAAAVLLPLDYYGSMAVFTVTPLYRLSELNEGFHDFVHVYFLACGLLFWVPILGADPATWRPTYRLKLILLGLGLPAYLAIASVMLAEGRWVSPAHSLGDIQRGGIAMAAGGLALTALGVAVVIQREHRHRLERTRRADPAGLVPEGR